MDVREGESRSAAIRRIVAEHGPIGRKDICLHLGIKPMQKGT